MTEAAHTHVTDGHSGADRIQKRMSFEVIRGGFNVFLPDGSIVQFAYHDAVKMADWVKEHQAGLEARQAERKQRDALAAPNGYPLE